MTTGSSGAYFFMPTPDEEEDLEDSGTTSKSARQDVEVEVLKQKLDDMFAKSAARMRLVGAKAERLHMRVRRRPDSVREMRAVLTEVPPPSRDDDEGA